MKELDLQNNSYKYIDEFSKNYGIKKEEQGIVRLQKSENKNEKKLILQSGSFSASEPLFILDEDNEVYTMLSIHSLNSILDSLRQNQKENFELKLEKAIYQQVPIDFNDVWAVAMDKINNAKNEIDFEKLVKELKQEYPNLFVNMQAVAERIKKNERL